MYKELMEAIPDYAHVILTWLELFISSFIKSLDIFGKNKGESTEG